MSASDLPHVPAGNARFATTHWSMVRAAAGKRDAVSEESRNALEALCRMYWYPLYAHIRRRCRNAELASDLTQEFFTRLLDKEYLKSADARQGRFRTFLLTAVNHFLANEHDREQAQKRGGDLSVISIDLRIAEDRLAFDPVDTGTPETSFERRWAVALLEQVYDQLRREHEETPEKLRLFEELQACLPRGNSPTSYRDLAERLSMSETAVKVAVHRMRKRFAELLRQHILQTVSEDSEVDYEIRSLFTALSRKN